MGKIFFIGMVIGLVSILSLLNLQAEEQKTAKSLPARDVFDVISEQRLISDDPNIVAEVLHEKAKQGDVEAQAILGHMYKNGWGVKQNFIESVNWFRMAAEQGDADAQYNLGIMYVNIWGIEQDYKEAAKWYRKAAEQGNAMAQAFLGAMYFDGQGVEQDYKEAAKWCHKAAEQDITIVQYILGYMYQNGQGVEQDFKEAAKWWHKAAEQGNAQAQYMLGLAYDLGNGVIEDYVEAYKWLLLAGMNGEDVSDVKERLKQQMTYEQIAEAQQLAKEFAEQKEKRKNEKSVEGEIEYIRTTGTGFLISFDGYILTAQHVIEDAARVEIVTYRGVFPAQIINTDTSNDIAILKAKINITFDSIGNDTHLSLVSSGAVRTGDEVYTIGFPNIGLQGFEPKYTKGEISSLSGAMDRPQHFQISTPVQPGNSGGPLLNNKGQVIGVITGKLSEAATLSTSGTLPQNVNYALKSSYVKAFLEAIPEIAQQFDEKIREMPSERGMQIEEVKKSVVLVLCY